VVRVEVAVTVEVGPTETVWVTFPTSMTVTVLVTVEGGSVEVTVTWAVVGTLTVWVEVVQLAGIEVEVAGGGATCMM
jgi:hypothetical protein